MRARQLMGEGLTPVWSKEGKDTYNQKREGKGNDTHWGFSWTNGYIIGDKGMNEGGGAVSRLERRKREEYRINDKERKVTGENTEGDL